MRKGYIEIYCGSGKGKTSLALGKSIRACLENKSVIIIQFLKGRENGEYTFLENSGLDIKLLRFEKSERYYDTLTEEEQRKQRENIRNGLHYARKVITAQECDMLVLDEILGLPEYGIATCGEINTILKANSCTHIVMTGRSMHEELKKYADSVTVLTTEYQKKNEI